MCTSPLDSKTARAGRALPELLEDAAARIGLRPRGFANFSGTLRKRIGRRARALGLAGVDEYRAYLATHDGEWSELDAMCRITISRLYRDAAVMDRLAREVLPTAKRVWSAGCASGEEPYTIALLAPHARIVATDIDPALVERARRGEFRESSLVELPADLRARFTYEPVRERLRERVTFLVQDLRRESPEEHGPFDVVLCRNVAFTYFGEALQREVLARIERVVAPNGVLVIGEGEQLPAPQLGGLTEPFFRRVGPTSREDGCTFVLK